LIRNPAVGGATRTINVRQWSIAAALALLGILLVRNIGQMLQFASFAIGYPFELDYGEGIVWQQMRDIVDGSGYAPLGVYPAIVYHYPPVYHLVTAGVAALAGLDELAAGRMVSIFSTFAMASFAGLLTADAMPRDERPIVRWICGAVAGLSLATCHPVMSWFAMMRVDMLACALALAGLFFAIRAVEQRGAILLAAVAFVLAVYTKQTSIAAPVAAFLGLLIIRPRAAALLLASCLVLGLASLAWLSWTTDGLFLRHILIYNVNRIDLSRLALLGDLLSAHAVFLAVATIGVCVSWRRMPFRGVGKERLASWRLRLAQDRSFAAFPILFLFLGLKTLMLVTILKSGSNTYYLVEWLGAVAIFAGIGISPAVKAAIGEKGQRSVLIAAVILAGMAIQAFKVPSAERTLAMARGRVASLPPLVTRIRDSAKPVISDDMVLLIRAGKPVRWEPAITAELAHSRLYDEQAFANMVRRQEFAFFVTRSSRGHKLYDDRYNPAVADAMDAAYPRKQVVAGLILHLPR
jgi:4-amino-4-deoxy-L-arabinose transferase-like glycosyltransferase